ncbi:MAG TPA: amino acid ABC transporter permease, partial [Terriglobales bacterium]|nr:amino acid ABC transporter permease [Terriglobales bacterium]
TLGLALSIGGATTARGALRAEAPKHGALAWARRAIQAYVELIRNTPFLVQMLFVFFGLPGMGIRMTALEAAVLAMTLNLTAYTIEIMRSGIEAVARGQREAGLALGLGPVTVFALVILPQALANVYPALVSQIIITMLESAVVSKIAVTDLAHVGDYIQSRNFRSFETYFIVTVIYLLLAVALRRLSARFGRRLFAGRQ